MVSCLGSVGIGLVWGWLLGAREGLISRAWQTVFGILVATLIPAGAAFWFQEGPGLAGFVGATLLAWWLHLGWRQALRRHIASTD